MAIRANEGSKVLITNNRDIEIVAFLPEQFALSMASTFESRDHGMGAGDVLGSAGSALEAGFGTTAMIQALSYAVWRGVSPIEFSLSLIFDAETSTKEDVHDKLVQLASLVLPVNNGTFLSPPIPAQANLFGSSYSGTDSPIAIKIGRQFFFESVAITSAALMTDSRMSQYDLPIAGGIELAVRTILAYGKTDWARAASMQGAGYADTSEGASQYRELFGGSGSGN